VVFHSQRGILTARAQERAISTLARADWDQDPSNINKADDRAQQWAISTLPRADWD